MAQEEIYVNDVIADALTDCKSLFDFRGWEHAQAASLQLQKLGRGAMSHQRTSRTLDAGVVERLLPALLRTITVKPVGFVLRQSVHRVITWLTDNRLDHGLEPLRYGPCAGDLWIPESIAGSFEQFLAIQPPGVVTRPMTAEKALIGNPYVDAKRIEPAALIPYAANRVLPKSLFDKVFGPVLGGADVQAEFLQGWKKYNMPRVLNELVIIKSQSQIDAEAEPLLAQEHVTPPLDSPVGTPLESAAGGA